MMSATMDDAELEHSNVLSLAEERVLYILDWPSQEEEDGQKEVMAFVVMKRVGGRCQKECCLQRIFSGQMQQR